MQEDNWSKSSHLKQKRAQTKYKISICCDFKYFRKITKKTFYWDLHSLLSLNFGILKNEKSSLRVKNLLKLGELKKKDYILLY